MLPTGRNFYSVDVRAVPTAAAYALARASADALALRYFQDEGEWPRSIAMSAWGTSNMRTGGDDIAQVLALIGARPAWEPGTGRVTGFEIVPLSELGRPRIDVTLRISGMFRDAFPDQIDLINSAVRAVAALAEPDEANPIAAAVRSAEARLAAAGLDRALAARHAGARIFGSSPGTYGAGLQALIDSGAWNERGDLAEAFVAWSSFAYGGGAHGDGARDLLVDRLKSVDAVFHAQDNLEHDILDSDDYYQFQGGLAAGVQAYKGTVPRLYHGDHSRPDRPSIRATGEQISRVVRGRAANPKWIAGMMRHGYKGASEMAATVDFLFAYAATTDAVGDHHFDQLFDAYIGDPAVADFIAESNPSALAEMAARFREAVDRGLWTPRSNSAYDRLSALISEVRRMTEMSEEEKDARHAEKMRKKKAVRDKIVASKTIEKGLVIVHTGKGKGKSTAAFGMVFRALGHGLPVAIVQFVKGKWQTGERVALEKFGDLVSINTMGEGFTWDTQDRQRDLAAARAAWDRAKRLIKSGTYKLVLLDELNRVSATTTCPSRRSSPSSATTSRPTSTSSSPDATPRNH